MSKPINYMAVWVASVGGFVAFEKSNKDENNYSMINKIKEIQEKLGIDSKYTYDRRIYTEDRGAFEENNDCLGEKLKFALLNEGYKVWGSMSGELESVGHYKNDTFEKLYFNLKNESGASNTIEWNVSNKSTGTLLAKLLEVNKGDLIRIEVKSEGVIKSGDKIISLREVKVRDLTKLEPLKDRNGEQVYNDKKEPIAINPEINSNLLKNMREHYKNENSKIKSKAKLNEKVNSDIDNYVKTTLLEDFLGKFSHKKQQKLSI